MEAFTATPRSRYVRIADVAAATAATLLLAYLGWRMWVLGSSDFFPSVRAGLATYAVVGLLGLGLGFAINRTRHRPTVVALRGFLYLLAALLATATARRVVVQPIPRRPTAIPRRTVEETPFETLSPNARSVFAIRVLGHLVSTGNPDAVAIPTAWPFPPDVEIAIDSSRAPRRVAARVRGSSGVCIGAASIGPNGEGVRHPVCGSDTLSRGLNFHVPMRGPVSGVPVPSGRPASQWLQYRTDAARSAAQVGGGTSPGWSANLLTGARATPSIIGRTVIVGTHGAGSLEAFDALDGAPRWRVMLPNWVHQDPVSDGRIVVVGFGNNIDVFSARAPSGVTALDLRTGRRIWTEFEGASVMTSPVITGDRVTYVTARGTVRSRRLSDGHLLGTTDLTGRMPMGPPVARGDSIVVGLDENHVCLLAANPLEVRWCVTVDEVVWLGHSAPTLMGDTILVGATIPPTSRSLLRNIKRQPLSRSLRWLGAWITDPHRAEFLSQRVIALALRDGRVLWETPDYFATRPVVGHTSGTAAIDSTQIVVNLPMPNVIVAFDRSTLEESWIATGGGSRGPALLVGNRIYVGTGGGEIAAYDARTGARICSVRVGHTFDRAGPAYAFGTLYFASTEGALIAVPKSELDACTSAAIQSRIMPPSNTKAAQH